MVKSQWVYRRLRNFRARIEAGISCFKRAYGGARCIWRGLDHFKAYIWSAVVAHNLMLFAPAGSGGRLVGLSGLARNAIPSLIVTTETRKRAANPGPATSAALLHC